MASWDYSTDGSTITFTVKGVPRGKLVRFYIRYSDSTENLLDGKNQYRTSTNSTSFDASFDILEEYTSYVCRVGYPADPTTWLGAAKTFKTGSFDTGPERPYNWNWYSTIEQGQPIKLSALEWNDFCSKINEFRDYCGLSSYNFTKVYRGQKIKSSVVNEARTAIADIPGHGGLPNRTWSGHEITAYYFKQLRIALNRIP